MLYYEYCIVQICTRKKISFFRCYLFEWVQLTLWLSLYSLQNSQVKLVRVDISHVSDWSIDRNPAISLVDWLKIVRLISRLSRYDSASFWSSSDPELQRILRVMVGQSRFMYCVKRSIWMWVFKTNKKYYDN